MRAPIPKTPPIHIVAICPGCQSPTPIKKPVSVPRAASRRAASAPTGSVAPQFGQVRALVLTLWLHSRQGRRAIGRPIDTLELTISAPVSPPVVGGITHAIPNAAQVSVISNVTRPARSCHLLAAGWYESVAGRRIGRWHASSGCEGSFQLRRRLCLHSLANVRVGVQGQLYIFVSQPLLYHRGVLPQRSAAASAQRYAGNDVIRTARGAYHGA